jgi:hypothetical protein
MIVVGGDWICHVINSGHKSRVHLTTANGSQRGFLGVQVVSASSGHVTSPHPHDWLLYVGIRFLADR